VAIAAGMAATRFSGMWRPAKTASGASGPRRAGASRASAWPVYSPVSRTSGAPWPSASSRSACMREKVKL
jgi:hypothetical protein